MVFNMAWQKTSVVGNRGIYAEQAPFYCHDFQRDEANMFIMQVHSVLFIYVLYQPLPQRQRLPNARKKVGPARVAPQPVLSRASCGHQLAVLLRAHVAHISPHRHRHRGYLLKIITIMNIPSAWSNI